MVNFRRCFVPGCAITERTAGAQLFRFPKNPERSHLWASSIGRPCSIEEAAKLYKNKAVCYKHFRIQDFGREGRFITRSAVPRLREKRTPSPEIGVFGIADESSSSLSHLHNPMYFKIPSRTYTRKPKLHPEPEQIFVPSDLTATSSSMDIALDIKPEIDPLEIRNEPQDLPNRLKIEQEDWGDAASSRDTLDIKKELDSSEEDEDYTTNTMFSYEYEENNVHSLQDEKLKSDPFEDVKHELDPIEDVKHCLNPLQDEKHKFDSLEAEKHKLDPLQDIKHNSDPLQDIKHKSDPLQDGKNEPDPLQDEKHKCDPLQDEN